MTIKWDVIARGLENARKWLSGKKTYLSGAALLVYAAGIKHGWWPSDVEIWGALGSATVVSVRLAIARMLKQSIDDL